nr:reverse transcriptase domain-containing protein [Tanacetum cinerariifolium]
VVGLIRWIEKTEIVFTMRKCTEANKEVFAAATFQDRALTWWNSQVTTLGIEAVTRKTWAEMKVMMTEEFCPPEEIQRMECELWNLRVKEMDISSYTTRCPRMVPTERNKVEAYIRGLSENIKGEFTSSEPATLNKAVRMAHTLMEQKVKAIAEREADNMKRKHKARDCWSKVVATGANAQPIVTCYGCGEKDHIKTNCPARDNPGRSGARRQAYALRDGDQNLRPNVVTDHSYEVELANGRVVSTNTILRGYALNLVNHLFEIDPMPIELGTFDVIIRMYWLILHDAVIVCGKKEVHVPLKNMMLVVKGDDYVSRLKVMSCMKVKKYVDHGSYLFVVQVVEKEPTERRLEDVPVICKFPDVFPEDFPRLPRQVEFEIELVPEAALVARAPYRLAPSKMKELANAPILALPKGSEDFVVYCDASLKGYGAVLMQREKVSLQKALATQLDLSIAYHLKMDWQSKRTIQTLEDMLQACVIDFGSNWDKHLPLVEFSYNNSYHASIKAALFEALIHDTFHVSNIKRYFVNDDVVIPMDEVQLDDKLHFVKKPVEIMDREVKPLKHSQILIVKVRWNSRRGTEFT